MYLEIVFVGCCLEILRGGTASAIADVPQWESCFSQGAIPDGLFILCIPVLWDCTASTKNSVLQRSGKREERLKKILEKRLEKGGNT